MTLIKLKSRVIRDNINYNNYPMTTEQKISKLIDCLNFELGEFNDPLESTLDESNSTATLENGSVFVIGEYTIHTGPTIIRNGPVNP